MSDGIATVRIVSGSERGRLIAFSLVTVESILWNPNARTIEVRFPRNVIKFEETSGEAYNALIEQWKGWTNR